MKKFIGIIVCIIIGLGILFLASISDTLSCSHKVEKCLMVTKSFGYTINEDRFFPSEYKNFVCEERKQPARAGGSPKPFYILKLIKKDNMEYNLGSFKSYPSCNESKTSLEEFFSGKKDEFSYKSGAGVTNSAGYILGVIMLVIAYIIATSKPEEKHYDWEDEEVDEN